MKPGISRRLSGSPSLGRLLAADLLPLYLRMIMADTLIRSRTNKTPNICISLKYIYRGLQHWSVTEFSALVLWCTSKGTHCCVFTCYLQLSCTTGPAKLVLCPTRIVRHVSGINVQNKQVPVLQHPDAGGGVPGVQS